MQGTYPIKYPMKRSFGLVYLETMTMGHGYEVRVRRCSGGNTGNSKTSVLFSRVKKHIIVSMGSGKTYTFRKKVTFP